VDANSFALPGVAEWVRTGSIWHVGAFLPLLQVRTYPNNGDVLSLAAILPWRDDAFLRVLPLPLMAMTGLGVYAIGRELGARAATAALLAAAAVSVKTIADSALYDLKPDVFMYATFAGGTLFLLRHVRTRARSDLLLAGLGLGLAFGSRWYGLSTIVVVLGVWAAGLLLARWPVGQVARAGGVLLAAVLAAGGFWLLRNLALTGNPLYPVKVHLLGVTLLDAPRDVFTEKLGLTIVDRLGQAGFLRHELLPGLRHGFGLPGVLAVAGTLLAIPFAVRGGRKHADGGLLALIAAAAALVVVYAFLPAGAQGLREMAFPGIVGETVRWVAPAFLLGAGATAAAAARLQPRGRLAIEAAACLSALIAARAAFPVSTPRFALTLLVLGVVCASAFRLARAGRAAIAASATVAALALAVAGYVHQRRYDDVRFEAQSAAVSWVDAHAASGRRVGVAGSWSAAAFVPIYGLFGPRFRNEVQYVGPIVSDQLRFYHDPARFRAALGHGRYDLLAVGRLQAQSLDRPRPPRTLNEPPEARWARSAGFAEVARDGAFILLARR
jgi:dolichyl-phosphate-mannose-protein mannosyltransferase